MTTEDYRKSLLKRLKDPEYAVGYLTDVLTQESQEAFLIALRDVIEAREENISSLSQRSGITRQGLYQALSESGNPHLATIKEILNSLGLQFTISRKEAA
ncbi:MAG: addiction module antidote protein [Xenococcaceae cyanobacterium]